MCAVNTFRRQWCRLSYRQFIGRCIIHAAPEYSTTHSRCSFLQTSGKCLIFNRLSGYHTKYLPPTCIPLMKQVSIYTYMHPESSVCSISHDLTGLHCPDGVHVWQAVKQQHYPNNIYPSCLSSGLRTGNWPQILLGNCESTSA